MPILICQDVIVGESATVDVCFICRTIKLLIKCYLSSKSLLRLASI